MSQCSLFVCSCTFGSVLFKGIPFLKEEFNLFTLTVPCFSPQEAKDKFKGWVSQPWYDSSVEISYKKVKDGYPLRLWRCAVEVNANPDDVIRRILYER